MWDFWNLSAVFHNWSKEARGLGGAKVGSPTVFSVSGLTSLDSASGSAGGWGGMPGHGSAGQERTNTHAVFSNFNQIPKIIYFRL